MKRPLALLVASVVVALVGAGCSSSGGGVSSTLNDAATIHYTVKGKVHTVHVSRDQLLSEVKSLVTNKLFAKYLKTQQFAVSATDLTADSKITAIWLRRLIQQEAITELFSSRHLKVTKAEHDSAATSVAQQYGTPDVFPAFSSKFRATLTDRQATAVAVLASYTDTSEAAAQAYYQAHASQFGCASGKDVAHILVKSQAAAQSVLDQLKGGASFAKLAEQLSTDKGNAVKGGALGCLAAGQFVAPFQNAADTAPLGTPVGPVHSQFGYHVILVTKAVTTFADVRSQVAQAMQQQGSQEASTTITGLLKSFRVHLDTRFGTWGLIPASATSPAGYQVTPPVAPKPASSREGTSTTVTVPIAPNGSP